MLHISGGTLATIRDGRLHRKFDAYFTIFCGGIRKLHSTFHFLAARNILLHQLVFQFDSNDFDAPIAIEDALIEGLGSSANVDGPDIGSGKKNVFIITVDPVGTFQKARDILDVNGLLPAALIAASRQLNGEKYAVIWPPGVSDFNIV